MTKAEGKIPYLCQKFVRIVKVLQKHRNLAIVRRPLHQLSELPVHGLHLCGALDVGIDLDLICIEIKISQSVFADSNKFIQCNDERVCDRSHARLAPPRGGGQPEWNRYVCVRVCRMLAPKHE